MRLNLVVVVALFTMVSSSVLAAEKPSQADMNELEEFASNILIDSGYEPTKAMDKLNLSREVTDRTAFTGTVSAIADWCGTGLGKRNFAVGLLMEKKNGATGKEQMDHIAAFHLATRDLMYNWLSKNRGECATDVHDLVVRVVGALPKVEVIEE